MALRPGVGPPQVLLLRALGLGDLLTAVPALRAVRRGWPGHELVLAAPAGIGGFARHLGLVDQVVATTDLSRLAWRPGSEHVAINLHGRGPQSHRLLLATGPRGLVAYAHAEVADHDGPGWDEDEHEVRRWCRLLTWAGAEAEPHDLLLPVDGEPSPVPGAVVVHPGAAYGSCRWPAERFARVAAALRQRGARVVVTGTRDERRLTGHVASLGGLAGRDDLGGRLTLPQLVAVLQQARAVACGDTGVGHLATACGAPTVHLFGPLSPRRWGPLVQPDRHVVLWHGDGHGDPYAERTDPALARITVAEVLAAVDGLLAAAPASASA